MRSREDIAPLTGVRKGSPFLRRLGLLTVGMVAGSLLTKKSPDSARVIAPVLAAAALFGPIISKVPILLEEVDNLVSEGSSSL